MQITGTILSALRLVVISVAVSLLVIWVPGTANTSAQEVTAQSTPYLALVSNGADGTVSVIDMDSGTVVQTITVGPDQGGEYAPGCIALSPDESLALVAYKRQGSHRVIALDVTAIADGISDNEVIDTIDLMQTVPEGANCIDITPDGTRAYVVGGTNGADIAVIDIGSIDDGIPDNEVTWIDTGNAMFASIAITPDGTRAYVTTDGYDDYVHVIDINPTSHTYNTVIAQVNLDPYNTISTFTKGIAITPDGTRAYVVDGWPQDKVYVIDTDPTSAHYHTKLGEIDLDPYGRWGQRIAITPDGARAYVTRSSEVVVIDTDPASPGYHTLIDTLSDIPAGEGGIAITSDGETALVVGKYQNSLSIIETTTGSEVDRISVGGKPEGVAVYRAPVPESHVKIVDEAGSPVKDALVYQNGLAIGTTDERGVVVPEDMRAGDKLVAILVVHEQLTVRASHQTPDSSQDWAYRIYINSLDRDTYGNPVPRIVTGPGQQVVALHSSSPLVLFNLVVSIEWDATDEYIAEIARAAQYASDFLYDLTDGQMAFGQVAIYDNGEHWADADVQISTKNIVRPHAYIGGITSGDKSHVIRVGRGWDGNSGNQGPWDASAGYRTLAHEFGHYALYVYDEYFAYIFDGNGNLAGEVPAYCTGPENRNPATEATNASVMDYQYTTSELSARSAPGLWSPLCEQTAQWQFNPTADVYTDEGESAWETLARKYADSEHPPRWQITTPADRGGVMVGPSGLPGDVLPFPQVTLYNSGASGIPHQLTVYYPAGEPYWGAIVALYTQAGRVIGQGFTDGNGRLNVYGAEEGDTLRAASFDAGLAGSVTVGAESHLNLTLAPVSGLAAQDAGETPHMRVVAEPGLDPGQVDLLVFLQNFGPGADPSVIVTEPGSEAGYAPTLSYSRGTDTYEGEVSFSATERGMGRIRALGAVGNSLVRLQSTYRLQWVVNDQGHDVYSDDGNLSLHLEPGSLPGSEAYFVVMPPGAVPGSLPDGLLLVGDPYDITASGALVELEKPGILTLHYDGALVNPSTTPEGSGIYRWDANSGTWREVGGSLYEEQKVAMASVTTLGTYALLAPPGDWTEPPSNPIFLPIILKGVP